MLVPFVTAPFFYHDNPSVKIFEQALQSWMLVSTNDIGIFPFAFLFRRRVERGTNRQPLIIITIDEPDGGCVSATCESTTMTKTVPELNRLEWALVRLRWYCGDGSRCRM
jgi:hypothetical protein